ncbi:hypothetical protein PIB30_038866 [Stylosanthes scabra]|uniref:Uncharacterized protein n=1 Tax=Stylosanthes scabra TaxID=79078 RepID=A0ABU6WF56_9FABA|nr:hypothetical protein [Stylosanthes scabra]
MSSQSLRSCRSQSRSQRKPLVQEECNFFQWADPEKDDDGHIEAAKLKKKIWALLRLLWAEVIDIRNPFGVSDSPPASAPDRIK